MKKGWKPYKHEDAESWLLTDPQIHNHEYNQTHRNIDRQIDDEIYAICALILILWIYIKRYAELDA